MIDAATAAGFARLTLDHVGQRWPYKLDQVLTGPGDMAEPAVLHPVFHGSFDWHSCVHGWWQLLTIARLHPDLPEATTIRARADAMLTADKVAGEVAYLARPGTAGFERPYGWAWALALHGEAMRHDAGWGAALAPLARAFAERFRGFLPKLTYPIRTGTHGNIAFALTLALGWARDHDAALAALIGERARTWFAGDRGCQAWEPGGDEFLSPALCEAALMADLAAPPAHPHPSAPDGAPSLSHREREGARAASEKGEGEGECGFRAWFDAFLPRVAQGEPATLFTPAYVSDRTDGKIAHLDGLNLSRAWCWRRLAAALGPAHPAYARMLAAAEQHLAASLPHLADDYMGTHWLASFALLALMA